ncbi:MAG: chromate transporter [Eubacteriales bacterium]|nr:chromate transporter [Eubacteriales bacterium]
MNKLRTMIVSMLKIGCIGFGGGSALIPVIEKEVVQENELISGREYDKDVIVASITPGALPVEIASGVGRSCGRKGAVLGAVAMALPGALATVLLLSFLSGMTTSVVRQIEIASIGITPFILYLLTCYIYNVCNEAKQESNIRLGKVFFIILVIFLLSGGKNIYAILGIDGTSPFVLSTVTVLGLSCFFIVWTHGNYQISNLWVPFLLGGAYLICCVLQGMPFTGQIKFGLEVLMTLLTLWKGYQSFRTGEKKKIAFSWINVLKEIGTWVIPMLVFSLPALVLVPDSVLYLMRGLFSSFLSFGGGDAYLTVADGMFVGTGMLSSEEFYGHLVSVANVLPGSILCKILTGTGYLIGYNVSGGLSSSGYLLALAGFVCSIAASGGVFSLVMLLYNAFEKIDIFQSIKRWIRPIIAGLLVNIMLSLIHQAIHCGSQLNITGAPMVLLLALIYIVNLFLAQKLKWKNIGLIVWSIGSALLFCNVIF